MRPIWARIKLAVLFLGISVTIGVHGEAEPLGAKEGKGVVLTINTLLTSMLETHPLLQSALQEKRGAEGMQLAAEGGFDRTLKGDAVDYALGGYSGNYYSMQVEQPFEAMGSKLVGGYRKSAGSFPIYDNYYETNAGGEFRVGGELSLLRDRDIDKRRTALASGKLANELAAMSIEQRKLELSRAAQLTYYEWVAAHERVNVYTALLAVARSRDLQFKKRTHAGDLAQFDQSDNARQVLQRETQLLTAQRGLQRAELDLSFFLRTSSGEPQVPSRYLPPKKIVLPIPHGIADIDGSVVEAKNSRPDLRRLERTKEQQELELRLAKNDLLPSLNLHSYVAQDLGAADQVPDEAELRVGVRLEVPLQTRNQEGRIVQYEAKQREIDAQAQALRDRIAIEITDASQAIRIAQERLDISVRELTLAKELEQGERTKFQQGDSNLIFVNVREQTTADAAIRKIDAQLELYRAVVQYQAAKGDIEVCANGKAC